VRGPSIGWPSMVLNDGPAPLVSAVEGVNGPGRFAARLRSCLLFHFSGLLWRRKRVHDASPPITITAGVNALPISDGAVMVSVDTANERQNLWHHGGQMRGERRKNMDSVCVSMTQFLCNVLLLSPPMEHLCCTLSSNNPAKPGGRFCRFGVNFKRCTCTPQSLSQPADGSAPCCLFPDCRTLIYVGVTAFPVILGPQSGPAFRAGQQPHLSAGHGCCPGWPCESDRRPPAPPDLRLINHPRRVLCRLHQRGHIGCHRFLFFMKPECAFTLRSRCIRTDDLDCGPRGDPERRLAWFLFSLPASEHSQCCVQPGRRHAFHPAR